MYFSNHFRDGPFKFQGVGGGRGGVWLSLKKYILIPNDAEKNILILVEGKKNLTFLDETKNHKPQWNSTINVWLSELVCTKRTSLSSHQTFLALMLHIAHLTINNNNTLTHLLKYNTELYRNLSGMGDLSRYWPFCLCALVYMLSKTFKSLGFPIYVLFQKRVVYTISTFSLLSTIRYQKNVYIKF